MRTEVCRNEYEEKGCETVTKGGDKDRWEWKGKRFEAPGQEEVL